MPCTTSPPAPNTVSDQERADAEERQRLAEMDRTLRMFWPETDADVESGLRLLFHRHPELLSDVLARLQRVPLQCKIHLLGTLQWIHVGVKNNLRTFEWETDVYGGGRDAEKEIPRKPGLIERTRDAVADLARAIERAEEECSQLDRFTWPPQRLIKELAWLATRMKDAIPLLQERAGKLVIPARTRGANPRMHLQHGPEDDFAPPTPFKPRKIRGMVKAILTDGGIPPHEATRMAMGMVSAILSDLRYPGPLTPRPTAPRPRRRASSRTKSGPD